MYVHLHVFIKLLFCCRPCDHALSQSTMHAFSILLALAASVAAYDVTFPNAAEGWSSVGANRLAWNMVSTDRANFSVILTNEDRSVMEHNNQILAALVPGVDGEISLNPPSTGWPVGGTFRVNIVQDSESLNSILAQSTEFNITDPTTTTGTSTRTTGVNTRTTFVATGTTGSDASSTQTESSTQSSDNAALSMTVAQGGVIGALAVLGALLA